MQFSDSMQTQILRSLKNPHTILARSIGQDSLTCSFFFLTYFFYWILQSSIYPVSHLGVLLHGPFCGRFWETFHVVDCCLYSTSSQSAIVVLEAIIFFRDDKRHTKQQHEMLWWNVYPDEICCTYLSITYCAVQLRQSKHSTLIRKSSGSEVLHP